MVRNSCQITFSTKIRKKAKNNSVTCVLVQCTIIGAFVKYNSRANAEAQNLLL